MFTSIAVPLDCSAFGNAALPYAVSLARAGGTVELLHVHHPYMPGAVLEPLPQYRFEDVVEADVAADAGEFLRETTRLKDVSGLLASEFGIPVASRVLRGNPAEALTEHVRASGAELIVMATHGRGGAIRAWLDSISDALVRDGSLPVLLVRPGEAPVPADGEVRFRHLLVCIDGSFFSEAILDPAVERAGISGAEITLLYVASPADGYWLRSRGRQSPHYVDSYLDALASKLPAEVQPVHTRVVSQWSAARAILDELDGGAYDLVAMASHGRGGVRPLLLGSTADAVLRGSHVPVLLFCPHEATHSWGAAEQMAGASL